MTVTTIDTWRDLTKGEPVTVVGLRFVHLCGVFAHRGRRVGDCLRRFPQRLGQAVVPGRDPRSSQDQAV
jgi:hypothetical protein